MRTTYTPRNFSAQRQSASVAIRSLPVGCVISHQQYDIVIRTFHLLIIALAGWLERKRQAVIDYLMEENRVFKEQLEGSGVDSLMNNGYDWP